MNSVIIARHLNSGCFINFITVAVNSERSLGAGENYPLKILQIQDCEGQVRLMKELYSAGGEQRSPRRVQLL